MKKLASVIASALVFASMSPGLAGGQGEAVFEAQRCGICHKPGGSSATPSLEEMAQVYQGKEEQLIKYLKGEAGPIIKPQKANLMKRPLEKTKALSDQERKALADFIMSR